MLCALKAIVIIGLFWFSQSLLSKESETLDLNDFVKKSHSLKETSLKETKEFLDSIPSSSERDKNNHIASTHKRQSGHKTDLIKDAAHLLKKTFRLEDGLNKDVMRPDFYIFISFSLPRKTLLNLLKDARKYDATLVLRGLKDGSFKKTMAELIELYKHEKGRLILDPTLFKKFNVTRVPTFLLTKPLSGFVKGVLEKNNQEFLVLRGNVSPHFALTEFGKHDPFTAFAKELLQ